MAVSRFCAILAVVFGVLSWAGAMEPRTEWTANGGLTYRDDRGRLITSVSFDVRNEGAFPLTVTGVTLDVPGLRLLPVDRERREAAKVEVAGFERAWLSRTVQVSDCTKVPREPRPVRFSYRAPLWSGESEVVPDGWRFTGSDTPVAWQRGLAVSACDQAVMDR
ncbi:hypothetical protein [Nonomuraea sp. NPDC049309]|uniref:hypothetical protein n=1 Tax=Nonomuraea sp. NPDC049309 TaxID=3364350 RepID=UPI003720B4CC